MRVRMYRKEDCREIAELFYHTVHTVNAKDYTKEQLDVWVCKTVDLKQWDASLREHYSVVVVEDEKIVGFGDIASRSRLSGSVVCPCRVSEQRSSHCDLRTAGEAGTGKYHHPCIHYGKAFFSRSGDMWW